MTRTRLEDGAGVRTLVESRGLGQPITDCNVGVRRRASRASRRKTLPCAFRASTPGLPRVLHAEDSPCAR